ncbi:MAG: right-handed parallel beta-helix repeat-containing protein [Cytophagaceae bacterium]|nr:right-handed parallel beta-helix repeat-containing protein [Cytophagaceae bacterium]
MRTFLRAGFLVFTFNFLIQTLQGATFTVTITTGNDYSCGGFPTATNNGVPTCPAMVGSLGWAIASANANPGADIIDFNLPTGTIINVPNPNWLIISDASLTINATINGMAAAWAAAGSCKPILELSYGFSNGLDINGVAGVTIKGLVLSTGGNAITFRGVGVTSGAVQGCYIGLNLAGTATGTVPQQGVQVTTGASGVIIGGNTCALRNVFIANNNGGVFFDNGDNNTVIGNYFNLNAAGTAFVNPGGGQACIRLQNGSTGNIIGTNNAGEGNVMTATSGQACIMVESASDNTTIRNAYIGFAANGTTALGGAGTSHGIQINASSNGTVDDCVIGGFDTYGINLNTATINGWTFSDSKIGTDVTGNVVRANRQGGIFSTNANANITVSNCVISGNGSTSATLAPGIQFDQACTACNFTGNRIGVTSSGACLGNTGSGLFLKNTASATTIIQNNIIGCNGYLNSGGQLHGIHLLSCSNIQVLNNYTGTDALGTQLGNNQDGISLNSCSSILIQGNTSNYNNWGIFMQGAGGSNIIIGNTVNNNGFNNTPLAKSILNEGGGICAQTSNNNNEIGRAIAGQGNTVNDNKCGIHLRGDPGGTTGNLVYNNTVYSNNSGNYTKYPTDYSGCGIVVSGNSNQNKIGGAGALQFNTVYGSQSYGILIDNSDQVEIRRNRSYCNGGTTANRSNPTYAIRIINGGNNANGTAKPGPITYMGGIGITNGGGIPSAITPNNVTAGDVIEVYFDNACGCQLFQYLGDATVAATDWFYPAGGNPTPIPGGGYCQDGSTLPGGGPCDPTNVVTSGAPNDYLINSVTATRTTNPNTATGETSEPMDCNPTILPVDYLSFTAKRNGPNSAVLNWVTAWEKNNAYFEVLRSTDAHNFTVIGTVQGSATTVLSSKYTFTDEALREGTYYYMLNQVDFDGQQAFSHMQVVTLGQANDIEVVPTAVASGQNIRVLNFTGENLADITVVDMSGQIVAVYNNISGSTIDIGTEGFAPGIYMLRIVAGDQVAFEKVVVQ